MTQPNGEPEPLPPQQNPQNQPQQQYQQTPQPQYQQAQYQQQYQQNPYQQPGHPGQPVPDYMQMHRYQQHPDRWNGLAIAGFVCSFFIAILGLILSIVGLVKINQTKEKGRGLAIAGIVISVVSMVFAFMTVSGEFNNFMNSAPMSSASSSSQAASSHSSKSATTHEDFLEQYTSDLESRIDQEADDHAYQNVEQLVNSKMFQQQLQEVMNQLPQGVQTSVTAKGDTVTTTLTLENGYETQAKKVIDQMTPQQAHNDLQDLADSLDEICGDAGNTTVHLTVKTQDGAQLFNQSVTADND